MAVRVVGPRHLTELLRDLMITVPDTNQDILVELSVTENAGTVTCTVNRVITETLDTDSGDLKRAARAVFMKAMQRVLPHWKLPWGILTGIRPTKIIHRLLDQGMSWEESSQYLTDKYLISPAKASLGLEVARLQRSFLPQPQQRERLVSVYIGIPFCPSRCLYCSFPSYVGNLQRLDEYCRILGLEIARLGNALKARNVSIQSLYIGGGTPTVLAPEDLGQLLHWCREHLISGPTQEFTVEAGRPDTLDAGKLALMYAAGVDRISINPQSMVERTLKAIGRSHSPQQVAEAFQLARAAGFQNINMDIILGLPGEGIDEVRQTLSAVAALAPDSLTVHALAVKRASRLRGELTQYSLPAEQAGSMQQAAAETARLMGMRPYYLYRQKQIFGNLENTGYAKPELESLYNIEIMEERQSIFGVGAGAASKIVNPWDWSLRNTHHAKQPEVYYERWEQELERNLQLWDAVNRH